MNEERRLQIVRQFPGGQDLPVEALQAAVFLGGEQNRAVAAVAGDDELRDRFSAHG